MNKIHHYEIQIWNDKGDLVCGYSFFNEEHANEAYERAEKAGKGVRLLAVYENAIAVLKANREPCETKEEAQDRLQQDLLLELNECY